MTRDEQRIRALCDKVRETAFELHTYLRNGHLEKVYENGLAHRLRKIGLTVERQKPLQVRDADGTVLGDYFADLFVENSLVFELKAVRTLARNIPPKPWVISGHPVIATLCLSTSDRQNSRLKNLFCEFCASVFL